MSERAFIGSADVRRREGGTLYGPRPRTVNVAGPFISLNGGRSLRSLAYALTRAAQSRRPGLRPAHRGAAAS